MSTDTADDPATAGDAPTEQSADLRTLLALLDVERVDEDVFIGHHPEQVGPRTFGGQLLGQGIVAAGRTLVKGAPPVHAVNAHFVRGGDVTKPLEYRVDRFRDGKPFANRQVTAIQDDEVVFTMLVAFQNNAAGLEHAVEIPEVAYPEDLPPISEHFEGYEETVEAFVNALHPIDVRFVNAPAWKLKGTGETLDHNRAWMKTDGPMPDDPLLHVAALAYSSDTTVLDSIITTHGLSWGFDRLFAATVNHSMWFHREFRFDEWLLYATESPVAAGSRGIGSGRLFTRDGVLAASVVQEALIKYFPPRS